jgi:hypothetical protein
VPRLVARSTRLIAVLLAVEVLAAGAAALVFDARPAAPRQPPSYARPLLHEDVRTAAVRAVLEERAKAIATRDRDRWLGTVDPDATVFRDRQARLFDNLQGVPVQDWHYDLDPLSAKPPNAHLDVTRGPGWWAPGVTLRYRLAGFDTAPTAEPQHLTFVPRDGRWYLAADDDFTDKTARGLWDGGPVVVVRGTSTLVLGHRGSRRLMRTIADGIDAAVPRVTKVWGTGWARKVVVLVPSSQDELEGLVGGSGDYSRIAALATAELTGTHAVGDRILVNPPNFAKLGSLGRRVVLTHEVTHVATRSATAPGTPTWLVEGFADYVGYVGVQLPYRVSAQELRAEVRRGRLPKQLPADSDFAGSNADLAQVYEQAWLAATLLGRTYGEQALVRFYKEVGGGRTTDAAFRALLGTDTAAFTRAWRRDLQLRLR